MSITNHVPSLPLCQELNKAGLKFPKSCFIWIGKDLYERGSYLANQNHWGKRVAAPLASEIGEILPGEINVPPELLSAAKTASLHCYKYYDGKWNVRYKSATGTTVWGEGDYPWRGDDTLVDAMAKMLLYLREKGLI